MMPGTASERIERASRTPGLVGDERAEGWTDAAREARRGVRSHPRSTAGRPDVITVELVTSDNISLFEDRPELVIEPSRFLRE